MHFKRDRYVCGKQNKFSKKACPDNFRPKELLLSQVLLDEKIDQDAYDGLIIQLNP